MSTKVFFIHCITNANALSSIQYYLFITMSILPQMLTLRQR